MSDSRPTQIFHHAGSVSRGDRASLLKQSGATLWFTGLSGSGKSTLAVALEHALVRAGHAAYVLDGDNIRFGLNASPRILSETRGADDATARRFGLGFAPEDRAENIRRIGEVAKLFADAGLLTLVSFVSPYRKDRDAVRAIHAAAGLPFLEVHVNTPIEACETRDPKGLYKQARAAVAAGRGLGFTGIDDPYEPPEHPDLTFDASRHAVNEGVALVTTLLRERGLLPTSRT